MPSTCTHLDQIRITKTDTHVCEDCIKTGDRWVHLRLCLECGHVGCCDSSPSQHASRHAREADHPIARTYEPGEDWFWDYRMDELVDGPELAPPLHRPLDQPSPGPAGRVPPDWRSRLR